MKGKDLFYLLGFRPAVQTYGYEIQPIDLPKDGRVEYARWLHPREEGRTILQESVDELRRFLHEGEVAIDIGAHSGDSALPMALAVGASGCVVALEPNRYLFPVLAKNAALNLDKTRIVALPYAASREDGEIIFQYSDSGYCNGGRFAGISRWRHGHSFRLRVEGKNLLALLRAEYPELLPKIRYIKTDTEGHDEEVIESLKPLLIDNKPFLRFEVYKWLSDARRRSLLRLVSGRGYKLYRISSESEYRGEPVQESDASRWRQFDVFAEPA